MNLTFYGAARTVTGSRHLIRLDNGTGILVDCGLFQGHSLEETDPLNRSLGFDPKTVDYVVLTHAHMDHSGNVPKLVKDGFSGTVFCTQPTWELCKIMYADSAYIQNEDVKKLNKLRHDNGMKPLDPIYNEKDVKESLALFYPTTYGKTVKIDENVSFTITEAGHVLGSGVVNFNIKEKGKTYSLTFTGDIGRPSDPLLRPAEAFADSDFLVCESTYGDRLHDKNENATQILLDTIQKTCIQKQGTLVIPSFSLGRMQEVVFTLKQLYVQNKLPKNLKIFVDSPLGLNATNITLRYPHYLNKKFRSYLDKGDEPLAFENLFYVRTGKQSRLLNKKEEPCVIISASGMLEGGRILNHLKKLIGNNQNTVLFVGFSTPESRGGKLMSGAEAIEIDEKLYPVKAEVLKIDSYSAHADYEEMIDFLSCQDKNRLKKIFLVHGEKESQDSFRQKLLTEGYADVICPEKGQTFELN